MSLHSGGKSRDAMAGDGKNTDTGSIGGWVVATVAAVPFMFMFISMSMSIFAVADSCCVGLLVASCDRVVSASTSEVVQVSKT